MEIRNVRTYALEIAATGQRVEPGELVTVDDEALAAALCEQPANWEPASGPVKQDDESDDTKTSRRARATKES